MALLTGDTSLPHNVPALANVADRRRRKGWRRLRRSSNGVGGPVKRLRTMGLSDGLVLERSRLVVGGLLANGRHDLPR
jgi:hypothetical protein